jgi:hypothetical protein
MPLLLHMMVVVEPQVGLVLLEHLQSCKALLSWKNLKCTSTCKKRTTYTLSTKNTIWTALWTMYVSYHFRSPASLATCMGYILSVLFQLLFSSSPPYFLPPLTFFILHLSPLPFPSCLACHMLRLVKRAFTLVLGL